VSGRVKVMLLVAILVTVGGVIAVATRPRSPRELFFAMRSDLLLARQAAESCSLSLENEQSAFDAYVVRVDGMRSRIRELEALDERGVPGARYPEYLAVVDSFNRVLPDWEQAADSLRAHRDICEQIVRNHNVMADSARDLAREADLLDGRGSLDDSSALTEPELSR